jgi:hypothetical protein
MSSTYKSFPLIGKIRKTSSKSLESPISLWFKHSGMWWLEQKNQISHKHEKNRFLFKVICLVGEYRIEKIQKSEPNHSNFEFSIQSSPLKYLVRNNFENSLPTPPNHTSDVILGFRILNTHMQLYIVKWHLRIFFQISYYLVIYFWLI